MSSPNNKKRALKESVEVLNINASDLDVDKSNKKVKREESKPSGIFYENEIPDDVFPLGDSVFVIPSTFRGVVSVHIRKYKKYGKKYYPTSEGITLRPWWIEHIMDRESVPQNENHLRESVFLPESEIQITSKDFKMFTFTRVKQGTNSRSITISAEQYSNMLRNYNNITNAVLDHMFRTVNFLHAYRSVFDSIIEETLPSSLDVSLGTQYLLQTLENVVCNILKDKGLKEPVLLAEELWANRVETFNSHALSLEISEIADSFYHSLWGNEPFLALKPAMYVTVDFLKNLRLDSIIRNVRNILCPEDTFEYFENNE